MKKYYKIAQILVNDTIYITPGRWNWFNEEPTGEQIEYYCKCYELTGDIVIIKVWSNL